MFEVGFTEIVLILGLALLVLGPEKLPKLAAQIGRWTGRARSLAQQLRMQLDEEVKFQEQRTAHGQGEKPAPEPAPEQPSGYPPATAEEFSSSTAPTSAAGEQSQSSATAGDDPSKPDHQ